MEMTGKDEKVFYPMTFFFSFSKVFTFGIYCLCESYETEIHVLPATSINFNWDFSIQVLPSNEQDKRCKLRERETERERTYYNFLSRGSCAWPITFVYIFSFAFFNSIFIKFPCFLSNCVVALSLAKIFLSRYGKKNQRQVNSSERRRVSL